MFLKQSSASYVNFVLPILIGCHSNGKVKFPAYMLMTFSLYINYVSIGVAYVLDCK